MKGKYIISDRLIFTPDDVDLSRSPLRGGTAKSGLSAMGGHRHAGLGAKTYVLGAFNPGLCRLRNGNLLMMVRVAEALSAPVEGNLIHCIRWDGEKGFVRDEWPLAEVLSDDPRKFRIGAYGFPVYALTSLSWLLPVELNAEGSAVLRVHYDKIIAPASESQEYGIEDPRITTIGDRYYMTVCCVSAARHSTMLYVSDDGLDWSNRGIVLDHQNKDMLLFGGKIDGAYWALTRPLGECYFATSPQSPWHPGAAIHMASSPDGLHWKPSDRPFLRARKTSPSNAKIGGGSPPLLTPDGWLILYHGVEQRGAVGIYRTFWALLDAADPMRIIRLEDKEPLLEADPALTFPINDKLYLEGVVFTTGIAEHGDEFVIASGEADLACRITRIARSHFLLNG